MVLWCNNFGRSVGYCGSDGSHPIHYDTYNQTLQACRLAQDTGDFFIRKVGQGSGYSAERVRAIEECIGFPPLPSPPPPPPLPPTSPGPCTNDARHPLNGVASASSEEDRAGGGKHYARFAFDGDATTRWASPWSDNSRPSYEEWLSIDLGVVHSLCSITIHWEDAYASEYKILGKDSCSPTDWEDLAHVVNSGGQYVTTRFPLGSEYRHIRILMLTRGTNWGYSIWDVDVRAGTQMACSSPPYLPPHPPVPSPVPMPPPFHPPPQPTLPPPPLPPQPLLPPPQPPAHPPLQPPLSPPPLPPQPPLPPPRHLSAPPPSSTKLVAPSLPAPSLPVPTAGNPLGEAPLSRAPSTTSPVSSTVTAGPPTPVLQPSLNTDAIVREQDTADPQAKLLMSTGALLVGCSLIIFAVSFRNRFGGTNRPRRLFDENDDREMTSTTARTSAATMPT
jgi:hypothetical protein